MFVLQYHRPLRDLPSFPTRRSSDLRGEGTRDGTRATWAPVELSADELTAIERTFPPERYARWPRSEEHTSELQSPCNLVCRLLLEKKKKTHKSANEQKKML